MEPFSKTYTIDIRRLRVLRELRERGTVGATACALNLTASAISQQIAALSREAGVPLLATHGRGVRLTPQATLLLEHSAIIEAQLERARADLAAFDEGVVGHVTIGAFATAITGIVAPALQLLRRERPRLRVTVLEIEAPEVFTRLDAGDLDVAVTVDYHNGPDRTDPRFARKDLLTDPLVAALAEDHPLAGQGSIDLKALAEEPWIVGALRGPCQEVGLAACTSAGFSPEIQHRANDWAAVFALVAAGCGVALVPRMAVANGLPPGVALRELRGIESPSRHIYAAIRAGSESYPSLVPVLAALQTVTPLFGSLTATTG
jgi:DNA-binding transcriptional LysR family regulator